jgi:predicted histidine transporter YuiF (NhaC family)
MFEDAIESLIDKIGGVAPIAFGLTMILSLLTSFYYSYVKRRISKMEMEHEFEEHNRKIRHLQHKIEMLHKYLANRDMDQIHKKESGK